MGIAIAAAAEPSWGLYPLFSSWGSKASSNTSPERATVPWTAFAAWLSKASRTSVSATNALSASTGVGFEGAMGKNLSPQARYASAGGAGFRLWMRRPP